MKTPFWKVVFAIVRKDLRAELRSRELVNTMILFALLSVLVFSFALELDKVARREAISGVLWVTIIFSSILGLNRSMAIERDQGSQDAMLIAPIDRAAILVGKLIGNFLFTITVGVLLLVLTVFLFNIDASNPWLLVMLFLGTFGFTTIGTLLATMTVQTRSRESLLPIVMLPVALPLILGAVSASTSIINAAPVDQWMAWPQVIGVIDLVYLIMCLLMFPYVIEE